MGFEFSQISFTINFRKGGSQYSNVFVRFLIMLLDNLLLQIRILLTKNRHIDIKDWIDSTFTTYVPKKDHSFASLFFVIQNVLGNKNNGENWT